MRIFVSHSSAMTSMIKSVRSHFPDNIRLWLDVDHMVVSDQISNTLRNTIQSRTDYVLLFVDQAAAHSKWVHKEIAWALDEEALLERTILVPVVFDVAAWDALPFPTLKDRKYSICADCNEPALAARIIINDLLALLWRELNVARRPEFGSSLEVVAEADEMLQRSAKIISSIVFPYRNKDRLPAENLLAAFDQSGFMKGIKRKEFDALVRRLMQQEMLPGVVYDGSALYIEEEHYKWKKELASERKIAIAKAAARFVTSYSTIVLDSGSSTETLVDELCNIVELGAIRKIKVITNSTIAVSRLLETNVQLAADEETAPIGVYVTGGFVRPNTLAIVGFPDPERTDFGQLVEALGGADIAFVGVNGIDATAGFTTHTNQETHTKKAILNSAQHKYILGDSSKFGIVNACCFATFDDDVVLITNNDQVGQEQAQGFRCRTARVNLV